MNDEELLKKRFLELGKMAYQRDIPFFSDFLTLNEQNILNQTLSSMPPVCVKTMGGYNLAERKIAAFYPDSECNDITPIECVFITPVNSKFSDDLTHRDYLGSLMNLGLERSVFGDIIVSDEGAYVFCLKKISHIIINEISKIRHTMVKAKLCEFNETVSVRTKEILGTVASVRIDSVLSLATGISRSKAITYIEDAEVFVNGRVITTNSYNLKENDLISVRGVGKFMYNGITGTSKKGKTYISILKYC